MCSEYTYRPYRVLPQDSTSVSTCRFIESSKLTGDGYAKDFDVGNSLNVCCVYIRRGNGCTAAVVTFLVIFLCRYSRFFLWSTIVVIFRPRFLLENFEASMIIYDS